MGDDIDVERGFLESCCDLGTPLWGGRESTVRSYTIPAATPTYWYGLAVPGMQRRLVAEERF